MFAIPDFSYFAVLGFIEQMASYTNRSSSMILHNKIDDSRDKLLKQEYPYLITWFHNKTDVLYNIFLPYFPNQNFLDNTSDESI